MFEPLLDDGRTNRLEWSEEPPPRDCCPREEGEGGYDSPALPMPFTRDAQMPHGRDGSPTPSWSGRTATRPLTQARRPPPRACGAPVGRTAGKWLPLPRKGQKSQVPPCRWLVLPSARKAGHKLAVTPHPGPCRAPHQEHLHGESTASYSAAGAFPRATARPSSHAARPRGGKGDPDPRDEPVDHPTGRRRGGVGARRRP